MNITETNISSGDKYTTTSYPDGGFFLNTDEMGNVDLLFNNKRGGYTVTLGYGADVDYAMGFLRGSQSKSGDGTVSESLAMKMLAVASGYVEYEQL